MRIRRGQAMVELSLGVFTLALLTGALCGFAVYISRSLRMQNAARGTMPLAAEQVEVSFGGYSGELSVNERAELPDRLIAK